MKSIRIAGALLTLSLAACQEKGPHIDFGGGVASIDTTYTSVVPARQDRVVLMHEFTGVSCPPCPAGHRVIDTLEIQQPGRLAVIGIQPYGIPQASKIEGITRNDNRSQRGTDLAKEFGGVGSQIPVALIDQIPDRNTGLYTIDRVQWAAIFSDRLKEATPLNLYLTPSYTTTDGKLNVRVKVVYTDTVSGPQYLNLAIVEDDVIDGQSYPSYKDSNYVHKHVLRDFVYEGVTGRRFLDSLNVINKGRVFETSVSYTIKNGWNVSNCHVVGYVNRAQGSDRHVEQAAEVKIVP